MKANAPEKIHVQPNAHDRWFEGKIPSGLPNGLFVEYTLTDAFVEKACEFISLNVADYIDVTHKGGIEHIALQERFIDKFRKCMKGG